MRIAASAAHVEHTRWLPRGARITRAGAFPAEFMGEPLFAPSLELKLEGVAAAAVEVMRASLIGEECVRCDHQFERTDIASRRAIAIKFGHASTHARVHLLDLNARAQWSMRLERLRHHQ